MTMPSREQYGELIAILREIRLSFSSAKDDEARLDLSRQALREVMRYLWYDLEVLHGELTAPLAILRGDLHDRGQGAKKSKLLNLPRPLREDPTDPKELKARMGKAPYTVSEIAQGILAFALELLAKGGISTENGADWIADEARRARFHCADGSRIVGRQIKNWRAEISRGKAPALARATFERMRNSPIHVTLLTEPRSELKRRKCEFYAAKLIKSLSIAAPDSAPNPTARLKK